MKLVHNPLFGLCFWYSALLSSNYGAIGMDERLEDEVVSIIWHLSMKQRLIDKEINFPCHMFHFFALVLVKEKVYWNYWKWGVVCGPL